jgi:hypothetical protein
VGSRAAAVEGSRAVGVGSRAVAEGSRVVAVEGSPAAAVGSRVAAVEGSPAAAAGDSQVMRHAALAAGERNRIGAVEWRVAEAEGRVFL